MERRARRVLRTMSDYEEITECLRLDSPWPKAKQKAMERKIEEMANAGWVFLKACEANPLQTICSLGGILTLHFVRGISKLQP